VGGWVGGWMDGWMQNILRLVQMYTLLTQGASILTDWLQTFHIFRKVLNMLPSESFNSLPPGFSSGMNKKGYLPVALKSYLNTHSFYLVDKFFMFKETHDPFTALCIYVV
jgi:hypothetical protein